jgi:hypothetical protein
MINNNLRDKIMKQFSIGITRLGKLGNDRRDRNRTEDKIKKRVEELSNMPILELTKYIESIPSLKSNATIIDLLAIFELMEEYSKIFDKVVSKQRGGDN